MTTLNGTSETKDKAAWLSLVNAIAFAIIAIIGLASKSLELKNFEEAGLYVTYLGYLFIVYLILRIPDIVEKAGVASVIVYDKYMGVRLKYAQSKKE
jgi:hypothetical protein